MLLTLALLAGACGEPCEDVGFVVTLGDETLDLEPWEDARFACPTDSISTRGLSVRIQREEEDDVTGVTILCDEEEPLSVEGEAIITSGPDGAGTLVYVSTTRSPLQVRCPEGSTQLTLLPQSAAFRCAFPPEGPIDDAVPAVVHWEVGEPGSPCAG